MSVLFFSLPPNWNQAVYRDWPCVDYADTIAISEDAFPLGLSNSLKKMDQEISVPSGGVSPIWKGCDIYGSPQFTILSVRVSSEIRRSAIDRRVFSAFVLLGVRTPTISCHIEQRGNSGGYRVMLSHICDSGRILLTEDQLWLASTR
jgi:hypothetical protein